MAQYQFKGVNFPFKKIGKNIPGPSYDEEVIEQNIIQIITTPKGSRPMRPSVGSEIMSAVFESTDSVQLELLKSSLLHDLIDQEKRILIKSMIFGQKQNTLFITIYYIIPALAKNKKLSVGIPIAT